MLVRPMEEEALNRYTRVFGSGAAFILLEDFNLTFDELKSLVDGLLEKGFFGHVRPMPTFYVYLEI